MLPYLIFEALLLWPNRSVSGANESHPTVGGGGLESLSALWNPQAQDSGICGTPSLSEALDSQLGHSVLVPGIQSHDKSCQLQQAFWNSPPITDLCYLGPVGHPLQVQWVTQLPAGVLHILCSVTGALHGGHHDTLMVPVPCSMRGPSKRVMYQPVLGPGLNPRSKPCLRGAPAAGLELIWLPGTWSASSCALLSHSIHAFRPQSHPTPTQRPSQCLSPGAALWTCCPGHNSLQWKLVEVGKG